MWRGEDPWQKSHGTHCWKHGVNTMPAVDALVPTPIQNLLSPQYISKVLGRGAVMWWLFPFYHLSILRFPGPALCPGKLSHPLAFRKDQKLGIRGEGEFRAHLPHSTCLGAAFCVPLSLGPRLPRLARPSTYIDPHTELSSLVQPTGTAGPSGCCRMQAGILPTAALC